jgi:hypothetical protein
MASRSDPLLSPVRVKMTGSSPVMTGSEWPLTGLESLLTALERRLMGLERRLTKLESWRYPNASASRSNARFANARILATRSALPVSSVMAREKFGPSRPMHEWPAASP